DAAELGDFGVGTVAPVPEQRVARDLQAIVKKAGIWELRLKAGDLAHPVRVLAAAHLDHKKVQMPVAIQIGKVHSHGSVALLAHCQLRKQPKPAATVVDPDAVHGLKIVADIDVRKPVLVDVPDLHAQSEIPRR